ncbi:hypothetical protein QTP86_015807 [Hemibagrus guttatus]|nr:hypothetical protein QTP86_015807 [Hemibagrus guttatus]
MAFIPVSPSQGGVSSVPVSPSEGDIASVPVIPNEGGVASVSVIPSEGGVASVPVSPSEGGVASVPVSPSEAGLASVSVSPSKGVQVKEVWPLYWSVQMKEVWPLYWSVQVKEAWLLYLSVQVKEAWLLSLIQPAGLVERIQAIAQNVSNMAVRVEQILQNSMAASRVVRDGTSSQCEVPRDSKYPDCASKVDVQWMRARWTSDPCYAFYGVDGSDCSFLIYLSEVEWFCPPLAWRNYSTSPAVLKSSAKRQAAFRTDLSALLDQVGTGKESLSFMKRRIRRLASQWATAAQRLDLKLHGRWREQKKILVHVGFLTEESGDVFSPKVLKGGPLGEMVQWADILTALYVLGHNLKTSVSVKELQG